MLRPNSDRLDYGNILAPEANYKLDFAIGTTYSLDLDALIGGCIALGLAEDTDSELLKNPVYLLEALRSTGDKIALFCEAGQIHYPNKPTSLYVLLEKVVFQIITTKVAGRQFYPSFHPKFWLIRYIDKNENAMYKLAVLSRNLTFDRSWDISFCIKGEVKKRRNENSNKVQPVCDFLQYLMKQLPKDSNGKNKLKQMKKIVEELPLVNFDLAPDSNNTCIFNDFDFIPNGISSETEDYTLANYPLYTKDFSALVIMSPFISRKTIKDFNKRGKRTGAECILITRALELNKLSAEDCNNFKIYTMKDEIIDGESMLGEDSENQDYQKEDIHAKIYFVRYNGNKSDLYLGSLNASENGISSNKEFMVRLGTTASNLSIKDMRSALFTDNPDGPENPFMEASITTSVEDKEQEQINLLDRTAKEIIRLHLTASVSENGPDFYDVALNIPEYKSEYKITINPLLSKKTEQISSHVIFSKLTLMQLSEFYVFSITDEVHTVQRILKIKTEGIPDNRDNTIVSSIVSNKECFYRYVAFLLGDSFVLSAIEADELEAGGKYNYSNSDKGIPTLYEKMLSAAAYDPNRFKEIEFLIKSINDNGIIPEDFMKLYDTFKKVVKIHG